MSIKITEIREKIAEFLHGDRDYDQHDMARDAAEALDYWRATYVREHQRVDLADTKAVAASVACGMLRARAEKAETEVARLRAALSDARERAQGLVYQVPASNYNNAVRVVDTLTDALEPTR